MSEPQERIEKVYKLGFWPQNPESPIVKKRFREALDIFERLINHEWFNEILSIKNNIRILEICSGTGIGGIALAKVLKRKGIKIDLILSDIRESDLKIGEQWGLRELGEGEKVSIINVNALIIHKLKIKRDIILMYGLSAPHFSPWEFVKLLASISEVLEDDGLFVMEEADRVYSILYKTGYKDLVAERVDEKALISLHAGYNPIKGTFKRAYIDLINTEKPVKIPTYFWNLAELMTLTWLFFNEVDFIPYNKEKTRGLIIGYRPRRKINTIDLELEPKILRIIKEEE